MTRNWEKELYFCQGMTINRAISSLKCGRTSFYKHLNELIKQGKLEKVRTGHNNEVQIKIPDKNWLKNFNYVEYYRLSYTSTKHALSHLLPDLDNQTLYKKKSNVMLKKFSKPFDKLCVLLNRIIDDTTSTIFFPSLNKALISPSTKQEIFDIVEKNIHLISETFHQLPFEKNPQLHNDITKRIPHFEKILEINKADWSDNSVYDNESNFRQYSRIK